MTEEQIFSHRQFGLSSVDKDEKKEQRTANKGFAKMAGTVRNQSYVLLNIFVRADSFVHLIRHFANPRTVALPQAQHKATSPTRKTLWGIVK